MSIKAILVIAAALSLAACGTTWTADPAVTGSNAPAGGNPAAASGRDSCLIGTWNADVNDMAQQVAAKIPNGATGSGTGTLVLAFGDQMTIKYSNVVFTVNAPISDGITMSMKNTFTGEATSTDWKAKDGKLSGTMPAGGVTSTIETTVGGKVVPGTTTPLGGSLDMSDGQLGYTCAGNTATLISPAATWRLTKA